MLLEYATSPALLVEQLIWHQLPPEQAHRPAGELTYATVPDKAEVHLGRLAGVFASICKE